MKKWFIFLSALIVTMTISAATSFAKPDFAFPKKVEAESVTTLKNAEASGDGPMIVRSAINYYLALTSTDPDSLQQALNLIERVTSRQNNPATKSMLFLTQARILSSVYGKNQHMYDTRELPLSPLPSNVNLWSGEQFKAQIIALVDSALKDASALQAVPITDYKGVITLGNHTAEFYPTLFEFAARTSINILDGLSGYYTSRSSALKNRVQEIYTSLLSVNQPNPAPFINFSIQQINSNSSLDFNKIRDFKDLKNLYSKHLNSPYSTEALIAAGETVSFLDSLQLGEYYRLATECLKRYPGYFRADCLREVIASLEQESVIINSGTTVVPGDSLTINLEINNATKFDIEIYKVPYEWKNGNYFNFAKNSSLATLVDKITIETDSTIPFSVKKSHKIPFPKTGAYIIVPRLKNPVNVPGSFAIIHCTDISISGVHLGSFNKALTVNPLTGEPIKDATISMFDNRFSPIATGVTNNDGEVSVSGNATRLFAQKGDDRYAEGCSVPVYYDNDITAKYSAQGITDLAIYHPGDTVKWGCVLQSYGKSPAKAMPGMKMKVILTDVNNQQIDTTWVTTDAMGRASGTFSIPKEGLTGYYRITFNKGTDTKQYGYLGTAKFMVSDYKLPTFEVKITDIIIDSPVKGEVTVNGNVSTYSGFPLEGCDVNATICSARREWIWRGYKGEQFLSLTDSTNQSGAFSFTLSSDDLQQAPSPQGIFNVEIAATSPTGETQSASRSFTLGKPYLLSASIPSDLDISAPQKIDVKLTDLNFTPVNDSIDYRIVNNRELTVATGAISCNNPIIDFTRVPSGVYSMEFRTADPSLADSVIVNRVVLYRPDDKSTPDPESTLWVPITSYVTSNHSARILYATSADTQFVRYFAYTDSIMLDNGVIKVGSGMHTFDYTLPQGCDKVTIMLSTTCNYSARAKKITVVADASIKSIDLRTETFRDKITPGATETWKFTVVDRNGSGVKSGLILDMYNKSLDALQPYRLGIAPCTSYVNGLSYSLGFSRGSQYIHEAGKMKRYNCTTHSAPYFEIWDMSWDGTNHYLMRNMAYLKESKAFYTIEEVENTVAVTDTGGGYRVRGYAMEKAETAEAEDAVDVREDNGAIATSSTQTDNFAYRDNNVTLAFFEPTLTTDADGNLTFSFKVPNANTRWQLEALAFTPDMLVSKISREIVSNKPIMVQPNLPRFLRVGDKAVVSASVMNNSSSNQFVTTSVELFNPFSGKVLATFIDSDSIPADTAVFIDTEVDAIPGIAALGYRIKAYTDEFADGEQSLIPLLSSIEPVIDTMPFYISPDSTEFSMPLPEIPAGSTVTLQFCNNPAWYVATALPGLRKDKPTDALSAATSIFSAAVAEGILRDNPDIAEALRLWNMSNRSDSTLVSMLERNNDLKIILLNSTPWVTDAKNDTERMERLALLFDPHIINSTYEEAIKQLSILEAPGGGWSWMASYKKPSQWITENILTMIGELKGLKFLPDNKRLDEMTRRAVAYLDREADRRIKEYPKTTDISFTTMRDMFPDIAPSAGAKKILTNTISWCNNDWKSFDAPQKAMAASLLFIHGHASTSRTIISSLREFSVTTPEKGMWWPSLDKMNAWSMGKISATIQILNAFNTVEPTSHDIELIRQWLILQKEAKNWGTSVVTSEAVAAILSTGRQLTHPAAAPVITLNGLSITPDSIDSLLGYFRADITSLASSNSILKVDKQERISSWGAVFINRQSEIAEIRPLACDDASIEKSLFVKSGDKWINADTLHVGDLVQVNLTIVTKRDMDYVAIIDDRGACFEPVEQIPSPLVAEGIYFYRENRDSATNIFVDRLPKGTYRLSYELRVNNAGVYSAGAATMQCQQAPALYARSGGAVITSLR